MKPGVYKEISNADYHGGDGVNKGLLDVIEKSPLHAKAVLDRANDNQREPTAAQVIGTALHTLILEPEKFADEYVCELTRDDAPDAVDDRDELVALVGALNADRLPKLATSGTKDDLVERILQAYAVQGVGPLSHTELCGASGKDLKAEVERLNSTRDGLFSASGTRHELAAILNANGHSITLWADVRARWDAENEGMTVLSVDTYRQLLAMAEAVRNHPAAGALLAGEGVAEASIYWRDEATGELCRCRPDYWRADGVLVDLKSTLDASPDGFAKSLATYRYHVQAPWYLEGSQAAYEGGHLPADWARPKLFAFIAVEKAEPYAVGVYLLDAESLEIGQADMRRNLSTLAECRRTGKWPGYGDGVQKLGVPAWYLRRQLDKLGAA